MIYSSARRALLAGAFLSAFTLGAAAQQRGNSGSRRVACTGCGAGRASSASARVSLDRATRRQ